MRYLILILNLNLIISFSSLSYATVSLDIQPKKIRVGQAAQIVITQDNNPLASTPDISPLKKDFNIIGTEQHSNYTIINGQASSNKQWIIVVMPKKTGTLIIPSIRVGQEVTKELSLTVDNQGSLSTPSQSTSLSLPTPSANSNEVMLTAEVNNKQPYINEQVLYTVKLYNQGNLINAAYQPPFVDNGLFIPIGNGRHYQTVEKGQNYSVEEQQYAFFPQQSGKVDIHPPSFNALLYDVVPQSVEAKAHELAIDVQAVPNKFKSTDWLPAKKVILSEQYDNVTNQLPEGTTLTRKITLQAIGFPSQLLPKLTFRTNDSYSIYPEQAQEQNTYQYNEILGTRQVKVNYLLNRAGKVVLPSINIVWFNTATRQQEVVSLPEKIITVAVGEKSSVKIPTSPQRLPSVAPPAANNSVAWWAAGGFAIAWLLTLAILALRRWPIRFKRKQESNLLKLKKACLTNQPQLAKNHLLLWAKENWPTEELLSLSDLLLLEFESQFKAEINNLITISYSLSPQEWQGDKLWQCITTYKKVKDRKKSINSDLPSLNPD